MNHVRIHGTTTAVRLRHVDGHVDGHMDGHVDGMSSSAEKMSSLIGSLNRMY